MRGQPCLFPFRVQGVAGPVRLFPSLPATDRFVQLSSPSARPFVCSGPDANSSLGYTAEALYPFAKTHCRVAGDTRHAGLWRTRWHSPTSGNFSSPIHERSGATNKSYSDEVK